MVISIGIHKTLFFTRVLDYLTCLLPKQSGLDFDIIKCVLWSRHKEKTRVFCAVVRSTTTHCVCGCAHNARRGCGRLLHKECAVSVRAEKYQVCGVRKCV